MEWILTVMFDVDVGVVEKAEIYCPALGSQRSEAVVDLKFETRDNYWRPLQTSHQAFEPNIPEGSAVVE